MGSKGVLKKNTKIKFTQGPIHRAPAQPPIKAPYVRSFAFIFRDLFSTTIVNRSVKIITIVAVNPSKKPYNSSEDPSCKSIFIHFI